MGCSASRRRGRWHSWDCLLTCPRRDVSDRRDALGIPHIYAGSDADLFFGFGFAMAQDRLFQLDYLRRKAQGRLAEVLGSTALESDVLARTVGLNRIAQVELILAEQAEPELAIGSQPDPVAGRAEGGADRGDEADLPIIRRIGPGVGIELDRHARVDQAELRL